MKFRSESNRSQHGGASNEDQTHNPLFTKQIQYHYAMQALIEV